MVSSIVFGKALNTCEGFLEDSKYFYVAIHVNVFEYL